MYKITYIKLVNFSRFPLRDVELFEQDFKSKLTMIAGANGSGKSSLFNELSPLPSDKNNYYKNGYKEIHIQYNSKTYVLISDFRNGSSFQFLVDGVDENGSNNVTTQKELCYRHFGITPTIHELLIGSETFTDMSVIARKKLFSAIMHMNIDKVIENYNKLKEELKVKELIHKTQTSLLQAEELKLTNEHRLEQLKENHTRTREFIEYLLNMRSDLHVYKSPDTLEDSSVKLKTLLNTLEQTKKLHYTLLTIYPRQELERYQMTYKSNIDVTTFQLSELYNHVQSYQEQLKILSVTKDSDSSTLEADITEKTAQVNRLLMDLSILSDLTTDLETVKNAIYKLELTLPDVVRSIPTNPRVDGKRRINKERYEQLLAYKNNTLNLLNVTMQDEITCDRLLKELSAHRDDVTCPSCSHTWSPKDIPGLIREQQNKLSGVLNEKVKLKQQMAEIESELEITVGYFTLYRQYNGLRTSTLEPLKDFWKLVDEKELVFNNPGSIVSLLNQVNVDVNTIENIKRLHREIKQDEESLALLNRVKDSNYEAVKNKLESALLQCSELQNYKNTYVDRLGMVEQASKVYKTIEQLETLINQHKTKVKAGNLHHSVIEVIQEIDAELSKRKVTLIEIEKELHQHSNIQYTIQKYKKTIEDVNSDIKVLKIILDELSPKNGLIAKSVSSFLNIIIDNINDTISNIWNYKMVLKPINVESDSLNYKFKVEVEDKLPVEDISKVSKGMKEVINLSFKLVLYKLLRLEGFPLWLDELAAHLDQSHTSKMTQLIHNLSGTEHYSQLFLITHKENFSFLRGIEMIELG